MMIQENNFSNSLCFCGLLSDNNATHLMFTAAYKRWKKHRLLFNCKLSNRVFEKKKKRLFGLCEPVMATCFILHANNIILHVQTACSTYRKV